MKTSFPAVSLLLLGCFALLGSGCVTEYSTVSSAPRYSGTTLPAASRVAVVMVFQGGDPSPGVREDVRQLLGDYLAEKGSVLADDPADADYLVHVVLERQNLANPDEWTVVNIYSAQSLGVGGDDYYAWPGGIIEDDTYSVTSFSYVGFGAFYPVWFDFWDSPWYRPHVVVRPPHRPHHHYRDPKWCDDRRRHNPGRWHADRRGDDHRPPVATRPPPRRADDHKPKLDPKRDEHRPHDRNWRDDDRGGRRPPTVDRPRDRDGTKRKPDDGLRRDGPRSGDRHWTGNPPKQDRRPTGNVAAPPVRRPADPPRQPAAPHEVKKPESHNRVVIPGHPNHPVPKPAKEVARPAGRRVDPPAPQPQRRDPRMSRHDGVSPKVHAPESSRANPQMRRVEPRNQPPPKRSDVRRDDRQDRRPQPPPEKKDDSDRDKGEPRR